MTHPTEITHGVACHYCGTILDLRVTITPIHDDEGVWVDIAPEVDMSTWWAHIDTHRQAQTRT